MSKRNGRKLKNLLINPNFQLGQASLFALGCGLILAAFYGAMLYRVDQMITRITTPGYTSNQCVQTVAENLNQIIGLTAVGFSVSVLSLFIWSLFLSHRVAGASHAILIYIRDLRNGQYDSNRQLRRSDHLQEIMKELHGLGKDLKEGVRRS